MDSNQYHDDEFLHPLWLGMILLFIVIVVIGSSCFLRRRLGPMICLWFHRLIHDDQFRIDVDKSASNPMMMGPHNWAPTYIPAPSVSPKLYTLVRNMRMANADKESLSITAAETRHEEGDSNVFETKQPPINQNSNLIKSTNLNKNVEPETNLDRDPEAARKFYASMRQTALTQTNTSLDSTNAEPYFNITSRILKPQTMDQSKLFSNNDFFHSIANNI